MCCFGPLHLHPDAATLPGIDEHIPHSTGIELMAFVAALIHFVVVVALSLALHVTARGLPADTSPPGSPPGKGPKRGRCSDGYTNCNGEIGCTTSLTNDPKNCGACGIPCASNQICLNSKCVVDGAGAAAATIMLGPFDTCTSLGQPGDSVTSCLDNASVPGFVLTIPQAQFLSLAVYPNTASCVQVSSCGQAQLALQAGNSSATLVTEEDIVLTWQKPEGCIRAIPRVPTATVGMDHCTAGC